MHAQCTERALSVQASCKKARAPGAFARGQLSRAVHGFPAPCPPDRVVQHGLVGPKHEFGLAQGTRSRPHHAGEGGEGRTAWAGEKGHVWTLATREAMTGRSSTKDRRGEGTKDRRGEERRNTKTKKGHAAHRDAPHRSVAGGGGGPRQDPPTPLPETVLPHVSTAARLLPTQPAFSAHPPPRRSFPCDRHCPPRQPPAP